MTAQKTGGVRLPELSAAKRALLQAMLAAEHRPPPLIRRARRGDVPLSFGQERLYFLDRMEPGSAAYNVQTGLRLTGALDIAALERALGEVVGRHEALRTTFHESSGAPVQVVAPFTGFALPVEDLSALEPAEREREVRRRALEEAERPFDIGRDPLFRATLLRLGAAEHELLLCMHHIVTDGWSLEVLCRELWVLYAAHVDGREPLLPVPPVQYADFALWQRDHLRGEVLDGLLAWWRERLAGAPELLELPADRPRPATRTQRGGRVSTALSADVVERLAALARGEGATLFIVLLGAFQAFLAKYAACDDIVVGTPVAGRTRREVEGLIGFFVNTLALRTDLGGDPTFREVVRRVRKVTLGAYDHQELPFERLVAELRPERSLSHAPLFQVMFALSDADGEFAPPLDGLVVRSTGGEKATTKFDLSLTCSRLGSKLSAALEYSTDLFDRETAERMLGHLIRLVEQVAEDPDRRLSAVELLTEAERADTLALGRGEERPYPPDPCIHRRIEAQARRTPDAVAVVHEGGRITYAALEGSANRLARELRGRGVGLGSFVPVLAERGPRALVAMLAVMKAGAAFVPLDAGWPEERLRRVMDDLHPLLLLAGDGVPGWAASLGPSVLPVVIDDWDAPALEGESDPDDPLYAIYTSGSTGTPKGAIAAQGGIANRLHWMSERFGASSARCVLQTTRHGYDSAVWQLFWPLTEGGRTVIPRADGETDAPYLAALIEREGVTMTDFVPSVFNALVPELVEDADARRRLASLRTVVIGGEQITAATAHRFIECFTAVSVVNLYGPTECSIGSIHHVVSRADGSRIPIGRPIANTAALILDCSGRPVPRGVTGEIHLGGRCVGPGYLGDARKTAAAFVPDPFAGVAGARLYRTGDLGRYRADGSIECLGRMDQQVKVRGVRIEPGEIEAVLLQLPGVRGALVLAREAAPGEQRLVAYVASVAPEAVRASDLRAHLCASLPGSMVPAAFVALADFPRTPGGKVDRRALPAPAWEAERAYAAPRTPAEEILAEIWREVLGVERVGVHDGFFELGGHSLLATRVISRVRQAFGAELPLRALFEHPTVTGLAERVQATAASEGNMRTPPLRRAARDGDPPLSFGQERLWRAYRRTPADTSFNLHYGLRMRGALDANVLERALAELVRRHEPLRTTFREEGDRVMQVIHPASPVHLAEVDVSEGGEAALRALAAEQASRPFDLERGPLLRILLARLGGEEHALLLTLHHVVTDGWSTGVLMRELSALYEAFAAGRESPLPEPEVRYADYAAWQRARLSGEALERQLVCWRARLDGAPRLLTLPTDRPRLPGASGSAEARTFTLDADLSRGLRALARQEGCTLYMVLLAGFQALLSRLSGQEDVCVGTPVAGRMQREIEGLIGFFTNTLVVRTDLSGAPGFRALLARVRETTLGAYGHQELPFALLAEGLRPEVGPEEMPLFQVVFELEHARETLRLPNAEVIPLPRPGQKLTLRCELRLTMVDDGARIGGTLWSRTALFETATIDRMIYAYQSLLTAAVADPDRPLPDLPLDGWMN